MITDQYYWHTNSLTYKEICGHCLPLCTSGPKKVALPCFLFIIQTRHLLFLQQTVLAWTDLEFCDQGTTLGEVVGASKQGRVECAESM